MPPLEVLLITGAIVLATLLIELDHRDRERRRRLVLRRLEESGEWLRRVSSDGKSDGQTTRRNRSWQ